MENSESWRNNPCPLNPDWGLQDVSDLDLARLKQSIDTDDNDEMIIEALIYRAFLECPIQKGAFYNQGPRRPNNALEYLQKADHRSVETEDERIGYGIVINTFRMWITTDPEQSEAFQRKLIEVEDVKEEHPKHVVYMDVVHAYILSRLGPRWREKALSLYSNAVEIYPGKYEWLLGIALMVGRAARQQQAIIGWENAISEDVIKKFKEEKQILDDILSIKPDFNYAIALYGQVLFHLDNTDPSAEKEMMRALNADPQNLNICILASRFYRRKSSCKQAEKILMGLVVRVNTAEVHAQLGFLYHQMSRKQNEAERINLMEKALHHFKKATELDSCHYPSFNGKAKMEVLLGRKDNARRLFNDLFDGSLKDKPKLALEEFTCLKFALGNDLFSDTPRLLIKLSHRFIELFVTLQNTCTVIKNFKTSSLQYSLKRSLQTLDEKTNSVYMSLSREARVKLANAKLLLKTDMEEAINFHKDSIKYLKGRSEEKEILFGLGKCYIIKAKECGHEGEAMALMETANEIAVNLSKFEDAEIITNNLLADIHLAKAKAHLIKSKYNNTEMSIECGHQLKMAIQVGSLEACYIYIMNKPDLNEKFLLDENIPETLAGIILVCDNDSPLHTTFLFKLPNGSELVHNVSSKRELIRAKVDYIIQNDVTFAPDREELSSLVRQVKTIRRKRLQYELRLIQSRKSGNWEDTYMDNLSSLLHLMRSTMDNCISVCQKLLLKTQPKYSVFNIFFDWKGGVVNQDKCVNEVKKWATKKAFPKASLPKGFLDAIVEIQPMYKIENTWLAALGSFTSLEKHSLSDLQEGDTFPLKLDDKTIHETMKTEDIVKRSSKEVLILVKRLVELSLLSIQDR